MGIVVWGGDPVDFLVLGRILVLGPWTADILVMMKSQDIVILLKLAGALEVGGQSQRANNALSVRGLEAALGISKSEVSASLRRSLASGLAIKDRDGSHVRPVRRHLVQFLIHGLRFVFPARQGAMTRGIPTAFAAPMLEGRLISAAPFVCVWPSAHGEVIGQALEPLYPSVPEAALNDPWLYEVLALIDAVRIGGARENALAGDLLKARLGSP